MTSIRETRGEDRPRAWQRMLSGRRLDLLNPVPTDIAIEDIAHGLARVARWNGQTRGDHAFTVAQHSLLVEEIVREERPQWPQQWLLAALLHDAPEYVIGDLISPFKAAIGFDYKAFELKLLEAIHVRFGLPAHLPDDVTAAIKDADRVAAYYEATLLAGFETDEAERYFGRPRAQWTAHFRQVQARVHPWPLAVVHKTFLDRFSFLTTGAAMQSR